MASSTDVHRIHRLCFCASLFVLLCVSVILSRCRVYVLISFCCGLLRCRFVRMPCVFFMCYACHCQWVGCCGNDLQRVERCTMEQVLSICRHSFPECRARRRACSLVDSQSHCQCTCHFRRAVVTLICEAQQWHVCTGCSFSTFLVHTCVTDMSHIGSDYMVVLFAFCECFVFPL